jgi:predicted amidohydrolase
LRAAAIQLSSTPDAARNLAAADRLVRAAAGAGAELVVLPEKWPVLGDEETTAGGRQPLDGEALTWARSLARELGIDLVAGSIVEAGYFNTCVHVGPGGDDVARYRKLHMFDVQVGDDVYQESAWQQAGDEVVVSEAAGGVELGLTICYDLRFPELYRELAVRGARIMCVPSAFTVPTTRDHWEVLLRARAIENQCFVVAANQIGEKFGGRSLIVDPWGIVLAMAPDAETFIVADLDLRRLETIRERLPSLANRRPEVYA